MTKSWVIGGITFGGAAVAAVLVTASYPVAIWAVGFAAIYKATHPTKAQHIDCPLLQAAAAREDGDTRVLAQNVQRSRSH